MNETQFQKLGSLDQVVDRLAMLDAIISFLFQEITIVVDGEKLHRKRAILTDGEKICVNQERACLREYRDFLLGQRSEDHVRYYTVSGKIERKFVACIAIMKASDFKRSTDDIEVQPSNI